MAQKLAEDFPYVRVDLYNIEGEIYLGELTFSPEVGLGRFSDDVWDFMYGGGINTTQ